MWHMDGGDLGLGAIGDSFEHNRGGVGGPWLCLDQSLEWQKQPGLVPFGYR